MSCDVTYRSGIYIMPTTIATHTNTNVVSQTEILVSLEKI